MSRMSFVFKKITNLNYSKMFERIEEISKKSGKSKICLFFDIIYCGIKYQAGYEDYALFYFYNVPAKLRKTYVTRGINNYIVKTLNDPAFQYYTDDKVKYHEVYKTYAMRDSIYLKEAGKEEFFQFMNKRDCVMIKPFDDGCGRGIEKLNKADFESLNDMYDYIMKTDALLVEEVISQHPKMQQLHPCSVNTLRVVTIYDRKNDIVHIPFASIRIGNGKPVDNINSGGMTSAVDTQKGIVLYPAATKNHSLYEKHPMTGVRIVGFEIPYWDEVIEFMNKVARVTPQLGYVGWDVAITEKGPLLIEGNAYPANDIYQMPGMTKDGRGILERFEKAMNYSFY